MLKILDLIRVKQYIKNIFIFLPMFFSLNLFDVNLLIKTSIGFALFSMVASSIYILNDIKDIKEDKTHPIKQKRPIASGEIGFKFAILLMLNLLLVGLVGAYFLNLKFFIILSIYFLMNLAYSLKLKHIAILDIFIVSLGFVLRLFAGGAIGNIYCTNWIIIMTFLLALFIALAKRRDDILLNNAGLSTRKNIDGYNLDFVNASLGIITTITLMAYIQYSISIETINRFHSTYVYLTTIFVLLGFLRYLQITLVENNSGSPSDLVLKDKFLILTILSWVISFLLIAYF